MRRGICRILPTFVANNFEVFFLLPEPRTLPKDLNKYVTKLKTRVVEYGL